MSIVVKNLSFTYSKKTPFEKKALDNINLTINEGDFLGIIGHTGSGKTTFIQHLNALIKTQEGEITVFGKDINAKKFDLKTLRSEVGMVFQYPENQLFDETVEKDIAFGPKNLSLEKEEIDKRVKEAMQMVGLSYDEYAKRAPFELSGGEKRRVAIAGVLAMRPKILILDEPTAGLDPLGKETIMQLITSLQKEFVKTVIVISHDIDEISNYANRLIVFNDAKIAFDIPMRDLFKHQRELLEMGLDIPQVIKIQNQLEKRGVDVSFSLTKGEFLKNILYVYQNKPKESQKL